MIPIRFGQTDPSLPPQALAGVFHPAQGTLTGHTAVLLCQPFGQEAIRIHRFMRILGERLARAGIPSLRFDYFGTGDADGDDADGEMRHWREDVLAADAELRRRSGCRRTVWVGARLGATLALLAARGAAHAPVRVVAWEPVVDGPAYLRELARDHVQAIGSPYRDPVAPAGDRPPGEALGFEMSETLLDQIARIADADVWAWPGAVDLVAHADHGGLHRWAERERERGRPCTWHALPARFEWTAEEAMNTALVPQPALQCLLGVIQAEARP